MASVFIRKLLGTVHRRLTAVVDEVHFKRLSRNGLAFVQPSNLDDIFSRLDAWASRREPKGWADPEFVPQLVNLLMPVQQIRQEIYEFVGLLLNRELRDTVLEIGMGKHGGTHYLWRMIFRRVVTIEPSAEFIRDFKRREAPDSRSLFVLGYSHEPWVVQRVHRLVNPVDLLFIDGDHTYEAVRRDWTLYRDLVRPGGIIAFHDSACTQPYFEVARFLEELAGARVDGRPHLIHHIVHSKEVGLSYEVCEAPR